MNRDDNLITVTYRPINTCKRKNIEDAVASSDGAGAHRHSSVEMFLWKHLWERFWFSKNVFLYTCVCHFTVTVERNDENWYAPHIATGLRF
jgi:hypothetical protein